MSGGNAWGRNRAAIEQTIEALADLGTVEPHYEAFIAASRSLADAVDMDPANASLWRQYREAFTDLLLACDPDGGQDFDEAFFEFITSDDDG